MVNLSNPARNLRFLREIRGDTQGDIAALLGKNQKATVSAYENGRIDFGLQELMKLADHFHITETELLRKQFWRMSDEEIAALKTRWGEAEKAVKELEAV